MKNDLKPCPFCGDEEPCIDNIDELSLDSDYFFIRCENCGLIFGIDREFDTEEQAIEAWNRRMNNEV